MKKIKIVVFLIIIAFNFISCITNKYYNMGDQSNYIPGASVIVRIHFNDDEYDPFFSLGIEIYNDYRSETKVGIKKITVEEINIVTGNTIYDMKKNIYRISFVKDFGLSNRQRITDLRNFHNTGSIDIPIDALFSACFFSGKNPGINYWATPNLTLSINLKIEKDDGTIEQITREYKGKRKFEMYNFIQILLTGP
jgi:hypothetical protein